MGSRSIVGRAALVIIFGAAMGYLESACVVYLQRAIGLTPQHLFPVRDAGSLQGLANIELGREVATLVMLWAIGMFLGSTPLERLAWTSVTFGVWDISYYIWLHEFIGWPSSLGTWDLLFLLPAPWAGPVWAPVAVSVALIVFGLAVPARGTRGRRVHLRARDALLLGAGGLVVLVSFLWNARGVLAEEVPVTFPWIVFVIGMVLGVAGAMRALRRVR